MPLIKQGAEVADKWTYVEADGALPDSGAVVLPLARFVEESSTITGRNIEVGVRLEPGDDAESLVPFLSNLALIEVNFPKYTDGRGYSQAQLLRRRHEYTGELRAVGHVLQDQIFYMNRSGFDAYKTDRANVSNVMEALGEYSEVYQPAAGDLKPVFRKRH
ncbi:MAG: DUF934 domain-containing protein [Hyphomonas sp.]